MLYLEGKVLVFVFILIMIVCYELKVCNKNEFNKAYISFEQTTAVNGIFVLLVFLSHVSQYIELNGNLDAPYATMKTNLGQMVVATFLFYSGYGIMESIKKKGKQYIFDIPYKRFFKLFYHMVIAVMLYVIQNILLGRTTNIKNILLAFTGWIGIGNSNWYVFAIFIVYIITFISFAIFYKKHYLAVLSVTILSVAYVYVLMIIDKEPWFYNTIILYSVGMMYSLFKKPIEKIVMKNDIIYLSVGAVIVAVYYYVYLNRGKGIEWYSVWGILFMALVLLFTVKVNVNNKILTWFGSHVFSVYILQRLPMNVLSSFGLNTTHKYAYIVICFFITIALAAVFDYLVDKLDSFVYKSGRKINN